MGRICSVWTGLLPSFRNLEFGDGRSGFALQCVFSMVERVREHQHSFERQFCHRQSKRIWLQRWWRRDAEGAERGRNLFGIPAYARIGERHDYGYASDYTRRALVRGLFSKTVIRDWSVVPEIFGPLELHERRGGDGLRNCGVGIGLGQR